MQSSRNDEIRKCTTRKAYSGEKSNVWLQKLVLFGCVTPGSTQSYQKKPGIEMGLTMKVI